MVIVNIMKRKDASSVLVAVVLAFITIGLLGSVTNELALILSGLKDSESFGTSVGGWQVTYLMPIVSALLQVLVLEILARLYIFVHDMAASKR